MATACSLEEIREELKALNLTLPEIDNAYSTEELKGIWGVGRDKARSVIRTCIKQGLMKVVYAEERNIAGVLHKIPKYIFVKPQAKKASRKA